MDFEGSLREGIREAGFIYVVDGKIDYAIEISDDLTDEAQFKSSLIKHFSKNKIRQPLIYVAHHHTVEQNLLKAIMPYTVYYENKKRMQWEPWLDTKVIYDTLYPQEKDFSLMKLASTFNIIEQLEDLARKYCNPKKQTFHCALFDSIACYLLLRRISERINLTKLLIWGS